MTILNKDKARLVKTIVPQAIIVVTSMFSLLGVFINICTTLFFGLGENYTSLKQLAICSILAIISLYMGLGKEVIVSMLLTATDSNSNSDSKLEIIIFNKNKTLEYEIATNNTKCVYEIENNSITLILKDKAKLIVTNNCEDIINALKTCNIAIKTI